MNNIDVIWRRFELLRIRWNLTNGRIYCDPEVLPAALDWIDGELAGLEA